MIVTEVDSPAGSALLVVTQADHARLASELLGLIREPELAGHRRRGLLLRAVAEHDNGWWEDDSAPRLDRSGKGPTDFRRVPDDRRRGIWGRGVERFAAEEPYVAAMIAGHALRLLAPRFGGQDDWDAFLADLEATRHELAERLAVSEGEGSSVAEVEAELAADDGWLALADELALAAATGDAGFVHRSGWAATATAGPDSTSLQVAPFPWAGATSFALSCRRLPVRRYGYDAELGRALALARWERRPIRLSPLNPGARPTPSAADR